MLLPQTGAGAQAVAQVPVVVRELPQSPPIATVKEIRELQKMGVHAPLGVTIYTRRSDLEELAAF